VLRQHWPVLLVIALAAQIARDGVLEVATRVLGAYGWLWFYFVFALAPAATMTAWVLMLRRARSSLPDLSATPPGTLVVVIVPFVAYYELALAAVDWQTVSNGLLGELLAREFSGLRLAATDFVPITVATAVAAALIVLRWVAGRFGWLQRHPATGIPALYVEIVLFLMIATLTVDGVSRVKSWAQERQAWVDGVALYHSAFDWAGPAAGGLRGVRDWWTAAWQLLTPVLIVPVSALVVAAVALGLRSPEAERPLPLRQRGHLAWATVLGLVDIVRAYLLSRIGTMVRTLRAMLRAGLVVTLSCCIGFVALDVATDWMLPVERLLIGPHDLEDFWFPVSAVLARLNNAVWTLLLICLLAGTIGHAAHELGAESVDTQPREPGPLGVVLDADGGRLGVGR
jgi:hypothetical protein